ncbi:hypothetical protein [Paenibacillus dendritiformis]|uniref:hypothetical protein n=1 Tax=Paenibacillus dendritiformis TaxID=130049 RepID=UPI000DA987AA|nr:hypothetical protein [Paenibacillus dendritiformis]PZM62005.1 hypothetical protein DOE73_29555 [Paenibacillus dendritiformis]
MANEPKTTKAYKVSPELKDKLENLFADSGLETQEAFLEHVATLYEMQLLKEGGAAGYKKQIDELEYHTRRSVELFLGMIETEAAERMELVQSHDEKIAERAAVISTQEQTIIELQRELKQRTEELTKITKELNDKTKLAEQLEVAANDKALLVDEYRQRIDTLSGLVNDYKGAADENQELKTKVFELTTLTDSQAARVSRLEDELKAQAESKDEQLRQAEERHREALKHLTERKDIEKERELLALRAEFQAKLEKAGDEATEKLQKIFEKMEQMRDKYEAAKDKKK